MITILVVALQITLVGLVSLFLSRSVLNRDPDLSAKFCLMGIVVCSMAIVKDLKLLHLCQPRNDSLPSTPFKS